MTEMTVEAKAAAFDAWQAEQAAARAAGPVPYAGPQGVGQLAGSLQPPPPPEPPKAVDTPHPDETFGPGELGYYAYEHPADKPGVRRVQLVMVAHTDEEHVHGLVLGEVRNLASFMRGELTHAFPEQPAS